MKRYAAVFLVLLFYCANESVQKDGAIRVNGSWIKKTTIEKVTEVYRQEMLRAFPQKALESLPPNLAKTIAKQLVANELVLQEAKKRNIGCNEARLKQTLEGIKKQFPDSASLRRELAKVGQTEEDMKNQVRDGLAVDSMIKILFKSVDSVTEKACKDYYDANHAKFTGEKRYRVSQILFAVKKGATPAARNEIAQRADKVLSELKAGRDFTAAVKKYSDDLGTAKAGGDIGWFKKGDLKPEFDRVAVSLKQNEVSSVFETDAGYHIVKKTGEDTLPPPRFDQVKDQIRKMLESKKQNDVVKHFVDSLVSAAKIFYADTIYKSE